MNVRQHDVLLKGRGSRPTRAVRLFLILALAAGFGVLATLTALKALEEAFHSEQFPEALAIKVEELPYIFPVHMLTGGLALLLVPLTIALRNTRWHRLAGRVTAADVLIAGVTALPVAYVEPVTAVSAAGFIAQACVWMALLAVGIWNIRKGRVAAHQSCMLLMAAVTSGAMFFRLYLALWAMVGTRSHFKIFYACDAWIAWILPLMVMAMVIYLRRQDRQALPG